MAKQNIDWSNLGFGYIKTNERFVSNYKDGKWDDGVLTTDDMVTISECAGVLQYAQTVFEGLKAYTTCDGRVVVFRPDLNASRLKDSCERLEMPVYPEEKFIEAMDDDMNTANALSAIFELMREINAYSGSHADATLAYLKGAYDLFMELTGVLNIVQKHEDAGEDPDKAKIEELIAQRAAAKKNKDFAEADRIRDELKAMGVEIIDTPQGTQWKRV